MSGQLVYMALTAESTHRGQPDLDEHQVFTISLYPHHFNMSYLIFKADGRPRRGTLP